MTQEDGRDKAGQNPAPICPVCRGLPDADKERKREHNDCPRCKQWNDAAMSKAQMLKQRAMFMDIPWLFESVSEAAWLLLQPCFYCGRDPDPEHLGGMDRVNNNSQYAKGTVVPSCWPCNKAKGILDGVEFWIAVKAAKYYRDSKIYYWDRPDKPRGDVDTRPKVDKDKYESKDVHYRMVYTRGQENVELNLAQVHALRGGNCYYCGRPDAGSVDRVDSNVGYTEKNSVSVCHCCNFIKHEITEEEFGALLDRVSKYFTRERLFRMPERQLEHARDVINVCFRRAITHNITPKEEEDFIDGLWEESTIQDLPTRVSRVKATTNEIADCGDLTTFDLPLLMSYRRSKEGVRGDGFLVSKCVFDEDTGRYVDLVSKSTSLSPVIPTMIKLLHAIHLYKQLIIVEYRNRRVYPEVGMKIIIHFVK
eukprot:GHVU01124000.1.p1 GENE.GHVU01124000.1~~GHVU01124000.1.p1  ORF type:complete len:422 (-),score=48.63 GHVU01124000.1:2449-3714(-)